jgi:hypothetical protein
MFCVVVGTAGVCGVGCVCGICCGGVCGCVVGVCCAPAAQASNNTAGNTTITGTVVRFIFALLAGEGRLKQHLCHVVAMA